MILVADAHNDLLLELDARRDEPRPFVDHWRGQLEAGGVHVQVCPIFGAHAPWVPDRSLPQVLRQVQAFRRVIADEGERVAEVRSASDLDAALRDERLALMLSMEGVEALGDDWRLIELFWDLGVRMVSLTWNTSNAFADGLGAAVDQGLSSLGEQLVARLVELGAILDLAHASERTFAQILHRAPAGTVIVSHAACRAVFDTPRNLSDAQLRALADHGGVLGMMLLPSVVDPGAPTLARAVDHVEHAVGVMGVDRVALGADFFEQVRERLGWEVPRSAMHPAGLVRGASVERLRGPAGYPALLDALRGRGFAESDVRAIAGVNLVRFLEEALPR